jgi:large subunit ribosomal protein L19
MVWDLDMSQNIIQKLEQLNIRSDFPNFRIGDTVRVSFKISEGDKERVQAFEGVLIGQKRGGNRASIRVRKISFGEGVERVFPLCSPRVEKIEVMQTGRVRRAKLYYLRELRGKKARIKERQDFTRTASK